MTKGQETQITNNIRAEMTKVRNSSIIAGMKSAMGAILGICNDDEKSAEVRLEEVVKYCKLGIDGGINE